MPAPGVPVRESTRVLGEFLADVMRLNPDNFRRVQPGMGVEDVRRMLGMPAKRMRFALKKETDWDWQWIDPPNREMVFTATFGDDGRVIRSASVQKRPQGDH